jgi:transcription initiation factor IIE alpha subunit
MPKERSDKGQTRAIPEDILKEAISLKQELPQRSVTRILQILEGEKLISPGDVARSTLTRYLANLGLTQKELKQKEPKALKRGIPDAVYVDNGKIFICSEGKSPVSPATPGQAGIQGICLSSSEGSWGYFLNFYR